MESTISTGYGVIRKLAAFVVLGIIQMLKEF
ncbi:hypothetical protein CLOBOL_04468 [Enterocloster bolteae ATCC BAA-613]|uniref:Uncharacterized protein n=1 Tax=Enterocloster bolteae (strain ATCC BAA-613 / DSM 15670 / CCUG 46953 / JCM 12243 / WAL 16351) TaxID=411902 RepID=A8RW37_ENTBW|nr:hypothetical protein CLOBOL_04468 [Enterocloster bolteae ATCC BAA-613]